MAFVKRDVKDRVVQYPRRYQLVEVQSGIFDLIPVTGTITEPGTAINKAYLQPIEDILNSLLNTGIDKAKIAELAENSNLSDALQSFDTRAVNSTPQQIFDSMKKQMKLEFKQKSTIGNPPVGGTYVALLTINAYGDATGGYPTQLAIGTGTTGEIAIRIGTGASTWSTWVNITVPLNHASSGSTYGLGDASNYGHVKVRNDLVGTETSGVALTPAMGKSLNDKIEELKYKLVRTVSIALSGTGNYQEVAIPVSDFDNYNSFMFVLRGTVGATSTSSSTGRSFDIGVSSVSGSQSNVIKLMSGSSLKNTVPYPSQSVEVVTFLTKTKIHGAFSPFESRNILYNFASSDLSEVSININDNVYFSALKEVTVTATGTIYLDVYRRKIK